MAEEKPYDHAFTFANGAALRFIKNRQDAKIQFISPRGAKREVMAGVPKFIPTAQTTDAGGFDDKKGLFFTTLSHRPGWPQNQVVVGAGDRFYFVEDTGSAIELPTAGFGGMPGSQWIKYFSAHPFKAAGFDYFVVQVMDPSPGNAVTQYCSTFIIRSDGQRRMVADVNQVVTEVRTSSSDSSTWVALVYPQGLRQLDLAQVFAGAPSSAPRARATGSARSGRSSSRQRAPVARSAAQPAAKVDGAKRSATAAVVPSLAETLFTSHGGAVFLTPKSGPDAGTEILLPISEQGIDLLDDRAVYTMSKGFRYGDREFVILHIPVGSGDDGELYLVRDDGQWVLFGHQTATLDFEVKDGIFSMKDVPRRLDLDRFDAETWVISQPAQPVLNDDGIPVDLDEMVRSFATEVGQDVRLKREGGEVVDQEALNRMVETLAQVDIRNAILIGPGGSGKSELLLTLMRQIKKGLIPMIPRTAIGLLIDPASLGAGTKYTGQFENRVKALVEYAKSRGWVIVLGDELHAFRGQGAHSENSNDFFQMVKTVLASGQLVILGATTQMEWDDAFVADQPLYQRFVQIKPKAKTRDEVIRILRDKARRFTRVVPTDQVLELIYDLSEYFNAVDAQPRKSTSLLDSIYGRARAEGRVHEPITVEHVYAATQRRYQTDLALFDPRLRGERLRSLLPVLDRDFLGHEPLKQTLEDLAVQAYTGAQDPKLPKGRLLISGPKGHGKTTVSRLFAQHFGVPFHRIEMNQVSLVDGKDEILRKVAKAMRENSHSVILFDDLEKCPVELQNTLLSVLDQGTFWVKERIGPAGSAKGAWVEVDARHAFVLFATNAAEELFASKSEMGFHARETAEAVDFDPEAYEKALIAGGISEYLLSRVPNRVPLRPMDVDFFRQVLSHEAERILAEQGAHQKRKITLDDLAKLIDEFIRKEFKSGAVPTDPRRIFEQFRHRVRSSIAWALLEARDAESPLCVSVLRPARKGRAASSGAGAQ